MNEKYKFIEDLTSDVMFEAYGKDLREVFENAAEAVFSMICQLDKVRPLESCHVEVKAKSVDKLLIAWLQELIGMVDTEAMFFSRFEIQEIGKKHLKAKAWGESTSPEKGETVVKAVTYYKYNFEKTKEGYKARVSLDI